jgi:hypothetical protein
VAINQLQIPTPQINNAVDPSMWGTLGNLGNVYQKAQQDQAQQAALAQLGQGPQADAQTLLRSGVPSLATLGLNMQQKSVEQQREDAQNAERKREWEANYAILKQKADREDRSVSDIVQERRDAWIANGGKPEGPDFNAYLFNGALPDPSKMNAGGLTGIPLTTTDATGEKKPALGQLTAGGQMKLAVPPPGYDYAGTSEKIDTPTEVIIRDRATGLPIARYPKDVAGAAAQKVEGTAQGKASVDLPKAEADGKLVLDTIDKALAPHPGKAWSVGTVFKDIPAYPGTATADYRAILDQLGSQTFLEAYNSLKGGGAISNYEDKRASAAKARLSTAQSVPEFDKALQEYKEIVQSGVERMRTLAGKPAQPAAPAASAAPATSDVYAKAKAAIAQGANPKAVRERLLSSGVDPGDIGK